MCELPLEKNLQTHYPSKHSSKRFTSLKKVGSESRQNVSEQER